MFPPHCSFSPGYGNIYNVGIWTRKEIRIRKKFRNSNIALVKVKLFTCVFALGFWLIKYFSKWNTTGLFGLNRINVIQLVHNFKSLWWGPKKRGWVGKKRSRFQRFCKLRSGYILLHKNESYPITFKNESYNLNGETLSFMYRSATLCTLQIHHDC